MTTANTTTSSRPLSNDSASTVQIITEPLGGSALSRALQRDDVPPPWRAATPKSPTAWRERMQARAREENWSDRLAALAPAFAASGAAAERLERVRREGGVVVTTGQQPGLFGGPVYTWSKAVGALALADALERETGIATAAIFWAATDDADFAEASYTVVGRSGGADVLRSANVPAAGTPMSLTPLGDVLPLFGRLRDACGSAADPRALEAVQAAYGNPDASVGASYVTLLRSLLAPLGMPVLDASHPAVLAASDDTMRHALRSAARIETALASRSVELRTMGYDPQVEDVAGLTLAFVREDGIKRRVSLHEAERVAGDPSAILTPNVLLRAIVERAILPTVAYLGGPGELAYFAQVSAAAMGMGVEAPLALPRWSCTLIEPHIAALLARFGVDREALATPNALEGIVARRAMSDKSVTALRDVRAAIESLSPALAPESAQLGLEAAVQGATQSLLHRMDRLERRLVAGIKRREDVLLGDVATLRAALYPTGTRQERALNIVPTLSRHGLGVLTEMRDAAASHARALTGSA